MKLLAVTLTKKNMSSFEDKHNNDQNKVTSEVEAWVGILYSCVAADKHITANETAVLSKVLHSKQKFIGVDIEPLFVKSSSLRAELGQLKFISACSEMINDEDKEMLFALVLEVLLADGTLEKEEKNLIEILSNTLNISAKMSSKIIEVIFMKNRGNIKGI
jgi:uncharacterized tellurite resistance protein B-like protein